MDKAEVHRIIEATLKSGNKTPGLFGLAKVLGVKSQLESYNSISEVIYVLTENRNLISKSFGLNDLKFDEAVFSLKAPEVAA